MNKKHLYNPAVIQHNSSAINLTFQKLTSSAFVKTVKKVMIYLKMLVTLQGFLVSGTC